MGESFGQWQMGNDEAVMPFIDIACIACGFHAGDPDVMTKTIALALKHNVSIGAHPGYPDMQGFGRRSLPFSAQQIESLVGYQLGALTQLSKQLGSKVDYIKPHGALYHDVLRDNQIFQAILNVIVKSGRDLILIGQFSEQQRIIAKQLNVKLFIESFADRTYQDNGKLVPRTQPNAVLNDAHTIKNQINELFQHQSVISINNNPININADAICIHGDNLASIEAIKLWRNRS